MTTKIEDEDIEKLLNSIRESVTAYVSTHQGKANESFFAMCDRQCPGARNPVEFLTLNPSSLHNCLEEAIEHQNVHNAMKLIQLRLKVQSN